jgi:glycine/D-amino acid oxidase-like deaminating enzyme
MNEVCYRLAGCVENRNQLELVDDCSEMLSRWPLISSEDVQLALYSPDDVTIDQIAFCQELAKRARAKGYCLRIIYL